MLNEKIALFSHDAGGAEVLSNWAKNNINKDCLIIAQGPAFDIFSKNGLAGFFSKKTIKEIISISDLIICSTSWDSDVEKDALREARYQGKKCISILDHWVNYKERFEDKNGKLFLPDEIWVCDVHAEKIAKSFFNECNIKLIKNPYLDNLQDEIKKIKLHSEIRNEVLYVCEPISEHAYKEFGDVNYFGYTEKDALIYFLDNFKNIFDQKSQIKIRPHPSEKTEKYSWVKKYSNLNITVNNQLSLLEDICASNVVVGCESMAMVVALTASKKVISSIPILGKRCKLPHKEIKMLYEIIK